MAIVHYPIKYLTYHASLIYESNSMNSFHPNLPICAINIKAPN
jgi:hypothetical protein